VTGPEDKKEFQTETRKLLDIVARSLYTEKEVFVRELISNASDALEKVRHLVSTGQTVESPDLPLEINLYCDKTAKTLTIVDTGIGMNKQELITNLGSIGYSGSSEFVKSLNRGDVANIIGQFGVGFYSVFMVSNKVTVFSKSAVPGNKGHCWISDGAGSYSIFEADGVARGTKIIIEFNDKCTEYALRETIEKIVKKYSNFVGFPIKLNGKPVNTVKALWTLSKNEITEQDHKEFYQFISHAYDEPLFHLHYAVDSPINIRSLFYVGHSHTEKYGMGRMDPGVSLFSRKILIQQKAKNLLPEYLRFVKGVVDSEDVPLNISREHLQDSNLIQRISNVLTKRILKWFDEEFQRDPAKYEKFWNEFGSFLKEGVCMDYTFKEDVAKLLRMESSTLPAGKLTSLDEYISRQADEDKEIYFVVAPSRDLALASPYFEQFKAKNKEVLLFYNVNLDDFVMSHLGEYKKKKMTSIESATISLQEKAEEAMKKQTPEQVRDLLDWLKETLSDRVSTVTETSRLVDSPAIIVGHGDTANYRRMMKFMDPGRTPPLPRQQLEINPAHEIFVNLNELRKSNLEFAVLVANQIFDNALIAAGLLDDARGMIPRLNQILKAATAKSNP